MKLNKNIFICVLLVFMVLLCINATSASDSFSEDLATNDTADVVSVSEDTSDEVLSSDNAEDTLSEGNTIIVDSAGSGTYTKISDAVSAADGGDTIYIKNGEYTEDAITFSKSLNVVGESQDGVIIKKSTGNTELFICYDEVNLTFSDFSITDSSKTGGTGLLSFSYGNINWYNCTFKNLSSKYGAMQYATDGTVNIEDCTFYNVYEASNGPGTGAIYYSGKGDYTIKNCLIDNCGYTPTSSQMYGIIYHAARSGSLNIQGTTISNCYGIANSIIRTQATLIINNSRIINNTVKCRSGTIVGDSLIYSSGMGDVYITQSMIVNNTLPKYLLYGNDALPFTVNYNNIQGNTIGGDFSYSYSGNNKEFNYNYWGEDGVPSDIPADLISVTIVKDGDKYLLSTGEELNVIIPGLNEEEPLSGIFVSPDGDDANNGTQNDPVKTIAKAVELAGETGQIVLLEGTYKENNIALDSDVNYTIIGKGDVVIDGDASSNSIFVMHGGKALFKNIVFTNNNPKYGGAIFINYETGTSRTIVDINVTVEKCTFENINATSRGGAIYAWYTTGDLIIKDSVFRNIEGGSYGAVTTGFSAFENGLNVEISGSTFEDNFANNGAAVYLMAKTVSITGSTFANNTASYGPGAIYLYNGTAVIDDCKIYNNSAVGAGAAIHTTMPSKSPVTTLTITNSIIENNYGKDTTLPAIYVDMNTLDISFCSLINDLSIETRTASSYDAVYGQGIAIANYNWWGSNSNPSDKVKGKNITLDNWVVMNLEANASEVVLYDEVQLTVDFNHVNTTSGELEEITTGVIPIDSFDVTLSVENGTITPSELTVLKGSSASAIYEVADPKQIITATYGDVVTTLDFTAGADPYFGVIYLSKDGDDSNNGSEMAPVATLQKAVALALNKHGSGEIIISEGTYTGCNFDVTRNLTVTGVGKVILDGENEEYSMFSVAYGTTIGKLELSNLEIVNVNRGYGAFVYNYGASEVILDNITLVGNTNTNIRFISTNTGSLTIKNSVISNNTLGGIICHSGSGNVTVINSTFENNAANKDSSIYAIVYFGSGSGEIIIEDCVFKNNTVRQNVVYSNTGNDIYMKNTIISDTKSDIGYGAAIRARAKLIVDNSTFLNNKAYRDGGAICIESYGDATITNSVFIGNSAGSSNHGDIISTAGKLTINYCVLLNNNTHKTIYNEGSYTVNAQYNWWGTNDDPESLNGVDSYYDWDEWEDVNCEYPDVSNWIVMSVATNMTEDTINVSDKVEITADFTKYMDSNGDLQDLTQQLPEFTIAATSNIGELNANEVTVKDGIATVIYTATESGEDTVNITSGLTVPVTINVAKSAEESIIYVSENGDDSNNGSKDAPVKSLYYALELVPEGGIIYLYNGTYAIDEEHPEIGRPCVKIEKSVTFKGESNENTIIHFYGEGYFLVDGEEEISKLTFDNLKFMYAEMESPISVYNYVKQLNVLNCVFDCQLENALVYTENVEELNVYNNYFTVYGPLAVHVTGPTAVSVNNNIFIGGTVPVANENGDATGNIDYNYWGSNDKPNDGGFELNNWVIANVTVSPAGNVETGSEATITVDFNNYIDTDGVVTQKTGLISDAFNVTFATDLGELSAKSVKIENGIATVSFVSDAAGLANVTISIPKATVQAQINVVETYKGIIYVSTDGDDTNEGSAEAPVATIAHALEISNGEIVILEGTHKVGDLGTISGDLNITGEGKVIIDSQNDNRILYVGEDAKVIIKNVIMTNGYTGDASGALLGNSNELTLINCTLANSTAPANNGGAIYNVGKLTIINSTIVNNKAKLGGAIFANDALAKGASIIIENSVFENNIATGDENLGGGAIFTQQIAEFTIENTTFANNEAQGSSCGGALYISHTAADITISDSKFIKNSAVGKSDIGGGAIYMVGTSNYERSGTLTVSNTLFDSNTAEYDGGAIYVRATTLNIANSVLINNDDQNGYAIFGYGTEQVKPSITADDNWWGTNDGPESEIGGYNYNPSVSSWAIMTVTNSSEIKEGESVVLTVSINNYTTGTVNGTLENPITVALPVTIQTSSGDIEGVLKNGEFATEYSVPAGLKYIRATVNDETVVLYSNPSETTVEISNVTAMQGERVTFDINVVAADGTVVSEGNVELYFGDDLVATIPVSNGKASEKVMISKEEGVYNLTAKFVDDSALFAASSASATLNVSGINNVVTKDNFFDFFDESGSLSADIPFDELIFKGEFEDLGITAINILKPIAITGEDAVFNNIGIKISSDDVTLKDIALNINVALDNDGAAVLVKDVSNVELDGISVNYTTPLGSDAYGIYIRDAFDVNLTNSKIIFDANNEGNSIHTYALHIRDSENVLVKGSLINATLPSLDVDYTSWGSIDTDLVLAVGIQAGEDIQLIENSIYSNVKSSNGDFPTLDTLMMYGTTNLVISHNNFTEIDVSGQGVSGYSNVVDLYAFTDALVEYNNIYVKTTTGVEGKGSAYPIQLTGSYSGLVIDHNNLTAIAAGPALGIYSQNYYGTTDITVTNNFINVTGLSGGSTDALVSGMELQDTVAKVYNNTIYSYNVGEGTDGLYGISYTQFTSGSHSYDIQNNTIVTQGKYAVYLRAAKDTTITGNILYASELSGDEAANIGSGSGNVIKDNCPPFPVDVIIEVSDAFIGNDNVVTVTVSNATGTVTIKVNGVEYDTVDLVDGVATKEISAGDLISGENSIEATYNGNDYYQVTTNSTSFIVFDGVITNATYSDYFDESGNLKSFVPDGATLDFQGLFLGKYTVNIDKSVNIVSTTNDAVFDAGSSFAGNAVNSFNILAGADNTNMTDLSFKNVCVYVKGASYVTIDGISIVANLRGVGAGTGFVSIHSNAYYTTVKNCYMENGGTGSSCLVLGKGGKYATFDNNYFNITGSSGNVLSSNVFVGSGELPQYVNYTNNVIDSHVAGSAFMYGITVCGQGNIIENNTLLNFKGNGIVNQWGATSTKNIYRNNTITGGGSMAVGTYSLIENNNVAEGSLTVTEGCTFTGNTAKSLTISGANTVVDNNTILGAVTINSNGKNTTFTDNVVSGTVTVSSANNTITGNNITTTGTYAIDLKETGNTVSNNRLVAAFSEGEGAINGLEGNVVEDNYRLNADLLINVDNITVGGTAIVNVSVNNAATGDLVIRLGSKKYTLPIEDGIFQVEIPDLTYGTYNVKVTYAGDDIVMPGENSTTFTVSKIKSDAIITIGEVNIGEDVNVTVNIEGATGNVNLVVDGKTITLPLTDGVAKYTMEAIKSGEHTISAVYLGDSTHDFALNSTKFTVDKKDVTIEVSSAVINVGQDAVIDIKFSEDIDDEILVNIGDDKIIVDVEDGIAQIILEDLKIGSYDVVVTYLGDDVYAASENTSTITVKGFDAGLAASSENINVSQNATISVEINSTVTGSVKVVLNNVEYAVDIVDGKGTVVISGLSNGTYTADVIFAGDDKFTPSKVNTTFTVSKVETKGDINISMNIPEGTTAPEFTVTLPEDATGELTVTVDGKNTTVALVNGSATVKVGELSVGNHTLSVAYSGDDKYSALTTDESNITIPKASIPGGESALNMTTPEGSDSPSFSINLPSDATGNLTVTVDGVNYTQALVNGSATVNVPKLAAGTHNVTVAYSGDDKYSSISKSLNLTVPNPVIKLTGSNVNALYTANAYYKVRVLVDGKVVGANEAVTVKFNGQTKTVNTDKNGYISYKLPTAIKPKSYTITATYKGQTIKNTIKVKSIIKAKNKKVKKSKKVTKVKVTLKKVNGKYLKSKIIKIKFKGKTYKVKTNKKGVAKWKVKKSMLKKLKVGKKYKYKVAYGKNTVTKKLKIKK